ncbi:MAG: hypothetical protein JRG96_17900, partial [Deltaproteobacteria bacterium]|nr:hypothetical protein [Deltaproteobacteria bacterium]
MGQITLAERIRDLEVIDDYVYLAAGYDGLLIVDVSDPSTPFVSGSLEVDGFFQDVEVVGSIAYVAASHFEYPGGLLVIDVYDPQAPVELGRVGQSFTRVDLQDGLAYATSPASGLHIIDVSNPTDPFEVGALDLPGDESDVHVAGDLAYLPLGSSNQSSTLRIVDVSDRMAPVEAGSIETGNKLPFDIEVNNGIGYVPVIGTASRGLMVYDVADPAAPVELAFLVQPSARDVRVMDQRVYFAFGTDVSFGGSGSGIRVIDASLITTPVVVGGVDSAIVEAAALDVVEDTDGHWVYVGTSGPGGGLQIFRVSDCPTVLPTFLMPSSQQNEIPLTTDMPVPMGFLGSPSLDVTKFDLASLAFGPAGATAMTEPGYEAIIDDLSADGLDELLLHFRASDAGLSADDQQLCLEGIYDGSSFLACAWVMINRPP